MKHKQKFTVTSFLLFFLATLLTNINTLEAQAPDYTYGNATGSNVYPLNSSLRNKIQWLYVMGEFNNAPVPSGIITKIYVKRGTTNANPSTFENLTIKIGHVPATMTEFSNTTFLTTEMEDVFYAASYTGITGGNADDWIGFELDTPFNYDGTSNLVVEMSQSNYTNGVSLKSLGATGTANRRIVGVYGNATGNSISSSPVEFGLDMSSCNLTVDLGPNISICEGESITLDAGNPGANYEWSNNATNQTINVNTAGTYYVTVSENGCESSDTIEVIVNSLPIVDLGNDIIICEGETISLDAGNPGATYEWSTNATSQTIEVNAPNSYYVVVTNAEGCEASDTINVSHFPYPSSNGIIAEELSDCTFNFSANNVENTTIFKWDFGDGSATVIGINPSHTYAESGIYNVTLTLINDCENEEVITSTVICENDVNINELKDNSFEIYPNPTSDLINIINTQNFNIESIIIYDVVGKKVMEIQPKGQAQNTVNLASLPNGMYHIHINTDEGVLIQKVQVIK